MNTNDTITDQDDLTTANVTEEVAEVAEVAAVAVATEDKKVDLGDAVAAAFKKHNLSDDTKPTKALPHSADPSPTAPGKITDPITGRVSEPQKPPAGWTPALREKWGTVDPTVQTFIKNQEKHVSTTLQEAADARAFQKEFEKIAAPYEATFRQLRTDAKTVTRDLMVQWHDLQTGTPQRKAEIFDTLLRHFKPDFAVLTHLSTQQGNRAPMPPAPQPMNVEAEFQRLRAAEKDQEIQQRTGSAIQQFEADPKNEFFADVRVQMGRAVDGGWVQGNTEAELIKNAYDFASQQNPEIRALLAGRAPVAAAPTAARPKAVGSVKPSLGTGASGKAPAKSMKVGDAVAEAMRRHGLA